MENEFDESIEILSCEMPEEVDMEFNPYSCDN